MKEYLLNEKTGILTIEGISSDDIVVRAEEIEIEGGFQLVGTRQDGTKFTATLSAEDYFEGKEFVIDYPIAKEELEKDMLVKQNNLEMLKSLIEVNKKERNMENLQSIYNTWKEEGIELAEQTGLEFVWDCGESIAREDFSNYAGLEKEITFEEMLALENEEGSNEIEMLKEVKDIPNRIGFTVRKDGFIVSTIRSLDNWYGKYETAITYKGYYVWKIAEGYNTEKEAIKGHKKYVNMTADEINNIEFIG